MTVSGIVLSFPNTQLKQVEVLVVGKISEVHLTLENYTKTPTVVISQCDCEIYLKV